MVLNYTTILCCEYENKGMHIVAVACDDSIGTAITLPYQYFNCAARKYVKSGGHENRSKVIGDFITTRYIITSRSPVYNILPESKKASLEQ